MSEVIDFNIDIASLTVRLVGRYKQTLDFCRDFLTDNEKVDITIEATAADVDREIARHPENLSREYCERVYLYREISEQLPYFNRFVFHGATIMVAGKGYVFTAPSGTGKSTHIALLTKYFADDVTIINGDKPIIGVNGEDVTVYSCPWSGKEGWYTNTSAPLGGIVLLKRGNKNSIKRINPSEYLEELVLQSYISENGEAFLKTLELLDSVARSVPFYLLECDISKAAAETSFKMIVAQSNGKE